MTSFVRLCALAAGVVLMSSAPFLLADESAFQPFEDWRAAALSGDQAALSGFYMTSPPTKVLLGKTPGSLDDEWKFWAHWKQNGFSDMHPKLLAINSHADQKQLIFRLQATKDGHALVASMVQIWISNADGWRIALAQRSDFFPDSGTRLPEPAKPNTQLYPDPAEAPAELTSALARAARENKRVLVVFGANWCYDCHVLDNTFHSKDFAPLVDANYVVLHVNLGDAGKDNGAMANSFGVALDHGIPSLAILSPDRKVVVAQRNGEFEDTQKIGPEDVRSFLEKWKPVRN